MAIVIVTRNQYIVASRINYAVLNESYDFKDTRDRNGRYRSIKTYNYVINVEYIADSSQGSREDVRECVININKKADAYRIYKNLIEQLREQMPDALFLNQAIDNLFLDPTLSHEEQDAYKEIRYDRGTEKVRRTRKTKRKS